MHSISHIQQVIGKAFSSIGFTYEPPELYSPITYTLEQGGKRLRPVLVLLSCDLFGGSIEHAIQPAMGLEIFHNFTLLHDDIMDQAPLRRGEETVFQKWNTNTAILSGDTMFVLAYEYVAKTDPALLPQVLHLFNDTARKVCEGQQYDMNFETQPDVTIPDYILMIRLKTAVLIACSLKLGAILANARPDEADQIYDFGINMGLAFQLQDDFLDVFGDIRKFGKQIGNDIVTNKKTFLYLKAFELARGDDRIRLTQYMFDRELSLHEKTSRITSIYRSLNVDQITRNEIRMYLDKALELLDSLDVSAPRKTELRKFTERLLIRES